MTSPRILLTILLAPVMPAVAQDCLPAGPAVVMLQGTIARGPAGRAGNDSSFILMLDKSVCVMSHPKKIREVQMVLVSDRDNRMVPHMLRDRVTVRGKLFPARSAQHQTPIWIEVETLYKTP